MAKKPAKKKKRDKAKKPDKPAKPVVPDPELVEFVRAMAARRGTGLGRGGAPTGLALGGRRGIGRGLGVGNAPLGLGLGRKFGAATIQTKQAAFPDITALQAEFGGLGLMDAEGNVIPPPSESEGWWRRHRGRRALARTLKDKGYLRGPTGGWESPVARMANELEFAHIDRDELLADKAEALALGKKLRADKTVRGEQVPDTAFADLAELSALHKERLAQSNAAIRQRTAHVRKLMRELTQAEARRVKETQMQESPARKAAEDVRAAMTQDERFDVLPKQAGAKIEGAAPIESAGGAPAGTTPALGVPEFLKGLWNDQSDKGRAIRHGLIGGGVGLGAGALSGAFDSEEKRKKRNMWARVLGTTLAGAGIGAGAMPAWEAIQSRLATDTATKPETDSAAKPPAAAPLSTASATPANSDSVVPSVAGVGGGVGAGTAAYYATRKGQQALDAARQRKVEHGVRNQRVRPKSPQALLSTRQTRRPRGAPTAPVTAQQADWVRGIDLANRGKLRPRTSPRRRAGVAGGVAGGIGALLTYLASKHSQ